MYVFLADKLARFCHIGNFAIGMAKSLPKSMTMGFAKYSDNDNEHISKSYRHISLYQKHKIACESDINAISWYTCKTEPFCLHMIKSGMEH